MKRLIPFLFVFLFSIPLLANAQASNMTSGTTTVNSANTSGATLSAGGTNYIGTQNNSDSSTNTEENQLTNPPPPPTEPMTLPTQPIRIDNPAVAPPPVQGNMPVNPPPRSMGAPGRP